MNTTVTYLESDLTAFGAQLERLCREFEEQSVDPAVLDACRQLLASWRECCAHQQLDLQKRYTQVEGSIQLWMKTALAHHECLVRIAGFEGNAAQVRKNAALAAKSHLDVTPLPYQIKTKGAGG